MNTEIRIENDKMNSMDAAILNQDDTICVEGSTKELCEDPKLFPVVEKLRNLKNSFIQDVKDLADQYDLDGSVKVVFSIYTRKKKMEEIGLD